MRRSKYQQIIDWNERQGDLLRLGAESVNDIDRLMKEADAVPGRSTEFIEFIPIRPVTALEVFLRGVITELIGETDDYFERSDGREI